MSVLLLKWGTLKGWDLKGMTDESKAPIKEAIKRYREAGPQSMSAMLQRDTQEQVEALCNLIRAFDGEIVNDWSGEILSKAEAEKYVREYPR